MIPTVKVPTLDLADHKMSDRAFRLFAILISINSGGPVQISAPDLASWMGKTEGAIWAGMKELRRLGRVEVIHNPREHGRTGSQPNTYVLHPTPERPAWPEWDHS
jgi:biotin operon repressor